MTRLLVLPQHAALLISRLWGSHGLEVCVGSQGIRACEGFRGGETVLFGSRVHAARIERLQALMFSADRGGPAFQSANRQLAMRRQIGDKFIDRRRNRTAPLLEPSQIVVICEARVVRQGMERKARVSR